MAAQDSNQNFRDSVALSRLVDPRSTLENLADERLLAAGLRQRAGMLPGEGLPF